MRFVRNEIVEQKIKTDIGLEFEFKRVHIDRINLAKSADNQARIIGHGVIPELVSMYQQQMKQNIDSAWPAIIVRKDKKGAGHYIVCDGNHRLHAYLKFESEPDQIDVYIVEGGELEIDTLTRSMNRLNGRGQDDAEAIVHMRDLIRKYPNVSIEYLIKNFAVNRQKVSAELRRFECESRLDALGIRSHDKVFTQTHYTTLSAITEDEVLKTAADGALNYKLDTQQTQELVNAIPKKGTVQHKQLSIAKFLNSYRIPSGATVERKVRRKVEHQMSSLAQTLNEHPSMNQLEITLKADRLHFQAVWAALRKQGDKVFNDAK